GGYDVLKSVHENGQWSQPENLGYPINSADDDVFFVVSASGEHGYYTSIKPDSYGEKDIYLITFLGPEKQVMLNTEDNLLAKGSAPVSEVVIEPAVTVSSHAVTLFKGIVTDEETGEPIEASIELVDNLKTAVVAEFNSNSATGKYLIALPAGNNYGIAVKADGYLFHSENFVIPEAAAYKEIRKNIQLQQIKAGKSIILKNIFFDIDKATLTEASTIELANAFELLDNNPSIKVEIAGHTDNTGSDAYNQRLSENRAKAVVDHLLKLGIKPGRLVYKGYGESEPAFGNETEALRQLNRRTEFKVLED
ncbi:MAG: OmpA family protein, partial [Bacteroidota bacterium]